MWELYTSQLVFQDPSTAGGDDDAPSTGRHEFPAFPITCPLPYALLCGVCLSPNAQDRPDLDNIVHVLLVMRHAAERGYLAPGPHNQTANKEFLSDTHPVSVTAVIARIHAMCRMPDSEASGVDNSSDNSGTLGFRPKGLYPAIDYISDRELQLFRGP